MTGDDNKDDDYEKEGGCGNVEEEHDGSHYSSNNNKIEDENNGNDGHEEEQATIKKEKDHPAFVQKALNNAIKNEGGEEGDGDDDDDVGGGGLQGLTPLQYETALQEHGYNEVVVKEKPVWMQIASRYLGIVPLFITTTAVLSAAIESSCYIDQNKETILEDENGQEFDISCVCNNLRDWASFVLLLIELNLVVYADYAGSKSSGDAMKKLQESSASTVGVLRCQTSDEDDDNTTTAAKSSSEWIQVPTRELVPGDVVAVTIGMTIPADGVFLTPGEPLKLDYSSLTGEPLPEKKYRGDFVLSGAVVLVGEGEMVVTQTGPESSLGTTQALIAEAKQEKETGGALSILLYKVVIFLTAFGAIVAIIVGATGSVDFDNNAGESIKQAFVLLSTILPVTMPLILTTTLAVGAQELAHDDAVVQRFSCIPELAHMDILCSDKTGTLTLGEMTCIKEESISFHDDVSIDDMMELALVASRIEHSDAIDAAITKYFNGNAAEIQSKYNITKFIPFDPSTKRVTAVATKKDTGEELVIVKGAPPVLFGYSGINQELYQRAQFALQERSERGFKTLAVCTEEDENEWKLLGLISILDPPRSDTAHTVKKCNELGVEVKMITGDQRLIAIEVARQLQLPNLVMFDKEVFRENSHVVAQAGGFGPLCERAGGFASVSPEHKHRVITSLQDCGHFVGMTGDGVNDAPALSIANVGIAVAGATDAARGASDIVLQQEGLSTIVKALYGSRKIFKRIETYLVYRFCCSFTFGIAFTLIYVASKYNFPTWTLILISLLNDFAVSSSSKDQVMVQRKPVSLDIIKSGTVGVVMAVFSAFQVWGLLQSLLNYQSKTESGERSRHFWGFQPLTWDEAFTECEIAAYAFLSLIVTIQLNLLAARTPKPFFMVKTKKDDAGHYVAVPPPSLYVLGAIGLSLTIATFIAVYWRDEIVVGSGFGMQGIGWRNAALVWCWAIMWFIVTDMVKYVTLILFDVVRQDKDGKVFFQNILHLPNKDASQQRVDDMRMSLRSKYGGGGAGTAGELTSGGLVTGDMDMPSQQFAAGSIGGAMSSLFSGPSLALSAHEDEDDNIVTFQDVILTSETLQNDPNLMRLVSNLVYQVGKLQNRIDKLEGKRVPSKKKLTIK